MSENSLATTIEEFIINDIDMGVYPSDVMYFDDNYTYDQSFLRSNSVYCYRSKYSGTKVVLNFPFDIKGTPVGDNLNKKEDCIKLITELNNYPFCFIKNNRIRSYVAPTVVSNTGFMMFAVEELALIQSAAASNLMFFEVTLCYFNFANVVADFNFVANKVVTEINTKATGVDSFITYEKAILHRVTPLVVSSLSSSYVWNDYVTPKVNRINSRLTETKVLEQFDNSSENIHPGLDVKFYVPNIFGNGMKGEKMLSENDGILLGPDSKIIYTTNLTKLDSDSLSDLIVNAFNQDFRDDEEKGQVTEDNSAEATAASELKTKLLKLEDEERRYGTDYSKYTDKRTIKTAEEAQELKKADTSKVDKNKIPGYTEKLIAYTPVSLTDLGVNIQKVEVRKKNILTSHKIGSYKHPFIQYMGKLPARVNIEYITKTGDIYKNDLSITAFITNAMNSLDRNRLEHPDAEVYNNIKVVSLANILLGVNSVLPNQNIITSTSDRNGYETNTVTFMQTDTEEFIKQFQIDASGSKSMTKAYDELVGIILQWLREFKSKTKSGKLSSLGAFDTEAFKNSLTILKALNTVARTASVELGYGGRVEELAALRGLENIDKYLMGAGDEDTIKLQHVTKNDVSSGLVLYLQGAGEGSLGIGEMLLTAAQNLAGEAIINPVETELEKKQRKETQALNGLTYTETILNVGNYAYWLSDFIRVMIEARVAVKSGKNVTLKNVSFKPTQDFNTFLQNAVALIATLESSPDKALTEGQKDFLKNYYDLYVGSLFGQNLEDIGLADLSDTTYDVTKDLAIQNTDPFFFLDYKEVLGDEMINFYNTTYQEADLDPSLPMATMEDGENEPTITAEQNLLGVSYRKLQEVDYNAEDEQLKAYEYGDENSSNSVNVFGTAGNINVKLPDGQVLSEASKAIENALIKYGLASDNEFRTYMYKTACIESGGGTNLNATQSSAKGLFQFLVPAIAGVMMHNNRVFASQGYVNLSKAKAYEKARAVHGSSTFARDFQLGADLFIEYMNVNGKKRNINGKFSEVATYAYHNQGGGTAPKIEKYLTTGQSTAITDTTIKGNLSVNKGTGSDPIKTWADNFLGVFSQLKPTIQGGKALPTGAPAGAQQGSLPKSGSSNTATSNARTVVTAGTTLTGKVKYVNDGDTFVFVTTVDGKNREDSIRLSGVDTKETAKWIMQANGSKTQNSKYDKGVADWGEAAKNRVKQLMPNGTPVSVKYLDNDARKSDSKTVRIVGEVTILNAKASEQKISEVLLREGLGAYLTSLGVNQKYQQLMTEAQRKHVGMWSDVSVADWNKKQTAIATKSKAIESTILNGARNWKVPLTNVWQPFADGVLRKEKSPFTFGDRRTDMGPNYKAPHRGVDWQADVGTTVIAAAPGIATKKFQATGAGLYVVIDHKNGFTTSYMHLSECFIKDGQTVAYKQPIGLSGGAAGNKNSGSATGPHLHYEVRYKGTPIHPYSTKRPLHEYSAGAIYDGPGLGVAGSSPENYFELQFQPRAGVTEFNTVYNEDLLAQAILTNAKNDMNVGLKAAMPAIKVYIVIGNENDGFGLDTLTSGPQYYEIKGVQSFQMFCNNDDTPVDTAVMRIVDPSFANTDQWTNMMRIPKIDYNAIGSDYETQFRNSRALLKPGTKLSIRLGYGNNPNDLRTVFNGGITELTNGDNQVLTLLLEGYGRELLAEVKSPAAPEKLAGASHASSSTVLGFGLQSKPIDHLGYMANHLKWLYKTDTDPESRALVKVFDTGHSWFYTSSSVVHRSRLYMNIFAPEIEQADDSFAKYWSGIFASFGFSNRMFGYPFFVYQMTPWDICKQMEYRHPGTIFKPMIFEDHMTPFYGVKEQMYFAKDLSKRTQQKAAEDLYTSSKHTESVKTYYDRRRERLEPVSNMHFVTSSSNLISNQMQLNGNWKTCSNVSYFEDNDDFNNYYDWKSVRMEVDDNILPWEIREKELRMSGTHGKYCSFVYGTTDLKKEAETMYQGKLLILGNSNIKCGDYIFLDDFDNRMSGLMLVRECIHTFDSQHGFVTEITPGLYVEPTLFMYNPLWLKLMSSMKVGAAKSRLMLSTSYTSEFAFIREYLSLSQQLETLAHNSIDDQWAVVSKYVAMLGLGGWLANSLERKISKNTKFLGQSLLKFGWTAARAAFTATELKLAQERVAAIKAGAIYQGGKADLGRAYHWARRQVIASKTYLATRKAVTTSRAFRTARFMFFKRLIPNAGMVKSIASGSMALLTRAGLAGFHAVAASNPFTLFIDVVFTLMVSWTFAKIEESEYTRQPLLFFPILRHGKPYQAGMTGAVRNSWWDSKQLNWERNLNTISKAAALHLTNLEARGHSPNMILSLMGQPALSKQAETQKWISTSANKGIEPTFDVAQTYETAENAVKTKGEEVTQESKSK